MLEDTIRVGKQTFIEVNWGITHWLFRRSLTFRQTLKKLFSIKRFQIYQCHWDPLNTDHVKSFSCNHQYVVAPSLFVSNMWNNCSIIYCLHQSSFRNFWFANFFLQCMQMDELEPFCVRNQDRLIPASNIPSFAMRIIDVSIGVNFFRPQGWMQNFQPQTSIGHEINSSESYKCSSINWCYKSYQHLKTYNLFINDLWCALS